MRKGHHVHNLYCLYMYSLCLSVVGLLILPSNSVTPLTLTWTLIYKQVGYVHQLILNLLYGMWQYNVTVLFYIMLKVRSILFHCMEKNGKEPSDGIVQLSWNGSAGEENDSIAPSHWTEPINHLVPPWIILFHNSSNAPDGLMHVLTTIFLPYQPWNNIHTVFVLYWAVIIPKSLL